MFPVGAERERGESPSVKGWAIRGRTGRRERESKGESGWEGKFEKVWQRVGKERNMGGE